MSVVAVCSGKGSPGATFVAINLAAALARRGEGVLLVDMDPAGGDVAACLGLDPRRGMYPILRMHDQAPEVGALLGEAEERAGMLAIGGFPEAWMPTGPDVLGSVLDRARESGRLVVADLGRVACEGVTAMKLADLVLLVVRPDLVSVLGAERALRTLEQGGVRRSSVAAIVSGAVRHRPGDISEIGAALDIDVLGVLPRAPRASRGALIAQRAIAKGPLAKTFDRIASSVLQQLGRSEPACVEVRAKPIHAEVPA